MTKVAEMAKRVEKVIQRHNEDFPISQNELKDAFSTTDPNVISAALSEIMKTRRHIHRKRATMKRKRKSNGGAIPTFVYWFDDSTLNNLYGQETLDKAKGGSQEPRNGSNEDSLAQTPPNPISRSEAALFPDWHKPNPEKVTRNEFISALTVVRTFKKQVGRSIDFYINNDGQLGARFVNVEEL